MKTDCDLSQKISLFLLCCCFSIYIYIYFFNNMGGFRGGEGGGGEGVGDRAPPFSWIFIFCVCNTALVFRVNVS